MPRSNKELTRAIRNYRRHCQTTEFIPEEKRLTEDNLLMFHPKHGSSKHVSDVDFGNMRSTTVKEHTNLRPLEDAIIAACRTQENCLWAGEQIVRFASEFRSKEVIRTSLSAILSQLFDRSKKLKLGSRFAETPRRVMRRSKK